MKLPTLNINFTINRKPQQRVSKFIVKYTPIIVIVVLSAISIIAFASNYQNGLGLSYNDARSHLNIGRRVVEGLKPGLAQIGSVWLPLPHLLMVPTIWNDFFWHTGLSGAIQSMVSFVATGLLIYLYLKKIGVNWIGRVFGVIVFAANLNILYLQSTAMTELLLIAMMTAGCYYLLLWQQKDNVVDIIKAAFFIMLSTLIRYDGWFLFLFAGLLIIFQTLRKKGYKTTEGTIILYSTLAGVGIFLWFVWNALIFKDPLYFAFGPFSAHAQQEQLEAAGVLATKSDILLSIKVYLYALLYNSYTFTALVGAVGAIVIWFDKKITTNVKIITLSLIAPLIFNIIALYLGHSVLFIQGISGDTWFNVRYGVMVLPSIAIFTGYLVGRLKGLRWAVIALIAFTTYFAFANSDAVTIDDATVGSSQKNVTEVSGWLRDNAADKEGFVLISAASHDAIVFSSGLPMKKFIHEGTGAYWESATVSPDRWARWIIMRTNDNNDLSWRFVSVSGALDRYTLVSSYPFADIYELKPEYLPELNTTPVFGKQK